MVTISSLLSKILTKAYDDAKASHHEFVTPEHVLKAALDIPVVRDLLMVSGADVDAIKANVCSYLEKQVPVLSAEEFEAAGSKPMETDGFQSVMRRAVKHCMSCDKSLVDITDVLVSMLDERRNYCSYYLQQGGIDRLQFIEGISNLMRDGDDESQPLSDSDPDAAESDAEPAADGLSEAAHGTKKSILERFVVDLTQEAREGRLEVLVGREHEIERTIQILCRRTKNNPLHVGDAGVGKTAITEGLAMRIAAGQVPDKLKGATIYSLDVGSLVAGTKFRGDFEERLRRIMDELKKKTNAILFIDEIHMIVGAGSSGGSMDAANLLKPALAAGRLRCIGSTTFEEYKKTFEKDRALQRRFQKIDVLEPTPEESVKILRGLRGHYESFHNVKYSNEALKAAVELSVQYLPELRLPDKAIDIMDEAGAYLHIRSSGGFMGKSAARSGAASPAAAEPAVPASAAPAAPVPVVSVSLIRQVTARMARVPVQTVTVVEKENLRTLEADIKAQLFGQNAAVEAVTAAVKRARAGFRDTEKPEACFLFVGPTGVGKTELAKILASRLSVKLLRYDMSEYQEKYTVSRLIGSAPGYVGYEEGGQLTDAVRKEPHAVVLFDEIEKAHSDIYNILLQVMDYGFLTDNQGRRADFRNCIIIMTSNAGARDIGRPGIGFGDRSPGDEHAVMQNAVEQVFSPEFRNRLDAVVPFSHLDTSIILSIVNKETGRLAERLAAKKVSLTVSPRCAEYLAQKGYSREFGARNIARTVDELIAAPLVDEVLFGRLASGGTVLADLAENGSDGKDGTDRIVFTYG